MSNNCVRTQHFCLKLRYMQIVFRYILVDGGNKQRTNEIRRILFKRFI